LIGIEENSLTENLSKSGAEMLDDSSPRGLHISNKAAAEFGKANLGIGQAILCFFYFYLVSTIGSVLVFVFNWRHT
jgi:hypothetical protein